MLLTNHVEPASQPAPRAHCHPAHDGALTTNHHTPTCPYNPAPCSMGVHAPSSSCVHAPQLGPPPQLLASRPRHMKLQYCGAQREVSVDRPEAAALVQHMQERDMAASKQLVLSPMTGTVVEVCVEPGAVVEVRWGVSWAGRCDGAGRLGRASTAIL